MVPDAQPPLGLIRSKIGVRNSIVDSIGDYTDRGFGNAESLEELTLHLFRMNKDMIGESILDSQCKTIEQRIRRVPPARINIVRGEDDFFPKEFVVKNEQRSVEKLKLIIP